MFKNLCKVLFINICIFLGVMLGLTPLFIESYNVGVGFKNFDINSFVKNTKNGIIEDANVCAQNDNTNIYWISWGATFHKFGFITHLLNVLQQNPNKEIIIFHRNILNENNFNYDLYKNVQFVNIQDLDYRFVEYYTQNHNIYIYKIF